MEKFRLLAAILILLFSPTVKVSVSAQSTALTNFIQSASLKHAGIGIEIVETSTGKIVCSYNKDQSFCPASCMKLVTTATALEKLGADYTYTTTVFTDGIIEQDGNLNGNIYIQGVGDPTLGSEFLGTDPQGFMSDWLKQIQNKGIKSVSGSVIALDNLFGYEGVSPKWIWEDIANYYAPGIYGISIFDNTYRLYLNSGTAGTAPEILKTEPSIPDLKFENYLKASTNNTDSTYIYGMPFSSIRRLYGTIPQGKASYVVKGDIPDPGTFLANYFTDFLKENGIAISNEASSFRTTQTVPKQTQMLATTVSPPLSSIIQVINFRSNNHYAEHLYRKIECAGKNGSEIKNYWRKQGLNTDGLFMYDGSGLSPTDGVSADFLARLLVYMNNQSKYQNVFLQSLPLAGKEGTVANLLKNTPLEGKVHAKSGSMENVQSYSGYINDNSKCYAFAIIVNKFNGSRSVLKTQIEQLLLGMFNNAKADI